MASHTGYWNSVYLIGAEIRIHGDLTGGLGDSLIPPVIFYTLQSNSTGGEEENR